MKHRKREPGSGLSSSKSNISRAMRGRIPKVSNYLAMRNQQPATMTTSHSEHSASSSYTAPVPAAQQTRTSDRNRRSPSYYGFESSPPSSTILPSGRCGKFPTPTRFDCRVGTTNRRKPTGRAEYLSSYWSRVTTRPT